MSRSESKLVKISKRWEREHKCTNNIEYVATEQSCAGFDDAQEVSIQVVCSDCEQHSHQYRIHYFIQCFSSVVSYHQEQKKTHFVYIPLHFEIAKSCYISGV